MQIDTPLALLAGLSPQQFMRKHWQKKPLLIRQAFPNWQPLLTRSELFELASRDDVESRLIQYKADGGAKPWAVKQGPFVRKALPALSKPQWTLLVQGVDLHLPSAHALLSQFAFVPQARLDDLMMSYATDGGGVGPHFDSYDVFLLQAHGKRTWRIGRQSDLRLQPNVPLKLLAHFEPEEEFVLEPGDMLYLPPRYAHDGIAQGECMTYSVGFRAPNTAELAAELVRNLADQAADVLRSEVYRDPKQPALEASGQIPQALQEFAWKAVTQLLNDQEAVERALGEYLTEPKAQVWFDAEDSLQSTGDLHLSSKTRMLYDAHCIYINGESFEAAGRDAALMQRLADTRMLPSADLRGLSRGAQGLVQQWCEDGWMQKRG